MKPPLCFDIEPYFTSTIPSMFFPSRRFVIEVCRSYQLLRRISVIVPSIISAYGGRFRLINRAEVDGLSYKMRQV